MMTIDDELTVAPSELIAQVPQLAGQIYIAHVHAGRAGIPVSLAVEAAATIIGAANGHLAAKFIARAVKDPQKQLAKLDELRAFYNDELKIDQEQKIVKFATALEPKASMKREEDE